MKIAKRLSRRMLSRYLLVAAVVSVAMFLYRQLVLPVFPDLDSRLVGALVATAIGGAAWWIVSRGRSS